MEKIVFKSSRKKIAIYAFASLVFIVLGLLMIFVLVDFSLNLWIILFQLIGLLAVVFSGYAFIVLARSFIKAGKALVIDEKGIEDYSSSASLGFVPWSDIHEVDETSIMDIPLILIHLKDHKKYTKQKKGFDKTLLNENIAMYNTPFVIDSTKLACDYKELKNVIIEGYERYIKN
jgi:hypothetical protein